MHRSANAADMAAIAARAAVWQRENAADMAAIAARAAVWQRTNAAAMARAAVWQRENASAMADLAARATEMRRANAAAMARAAAWQRENASAMAGLAARAAEMERATAQARRGVPSLSVSFDSARMGLEPAVAMGPLLNINEQIRLAFSPFAEARRASHAFAEFNMPPLVVPPLPKIRFSPEWRQLSGDIDAAESFDPDIAALSEQEMETPMGDLVVEMAVPALAGRIRQLGETWSVPALTVAACQLEEEDERWRTADDERAYASIIHRAVSVLEEVAWQVAYRRFDDRRDPNIRHASLRSTLKVLKGRRVITRSERARMIQAWTLRNKTHGAGHRVGGAPREAAGFVLLRVRQGLRDLLDGSDY